MMLTEGMRCGLQSTGGTGFVGAHTVAELVRQGYAVRLLVREPARVRPALGPLGIDPDAVESVVGDVNDPDAVGHALAGTDAVIHCASVYSLDVRLAATMRRTNVAGTEIVLRTAHRLGLDPIVHVSSMAALIGMPGATLGPDSPPTNPPGAYYRSKADSDRIARALQAEGAPVVITYPAGVWGPHDPHFGETCIGVWNTLNGLWRVTPAGGIPVTDVRDLARLHAAVLERGRGPRRYMATAQNVSVRDTFASLSRVTGRRVTTMSVPPALLLGPMWLLDALQRVLPLRLPFNHQIVYCAGLFHRVDDAATRREFGIEPRDLDETVGDTVRWMVQAGRLAPQVAGRATA